MTAGLTGGYCMPCANAMARAKEPVSDYVRRRNPEPLLDHLNPGEGVILSVGYHPGYAPDLTSWTIEVAGDGVLRQAVRWSRQTGRAEELLEPVSLDAAGLAEIRGLVGSCGADSFVPLERDACVDDVAIISLVMPGQGGRVDLPYFYLAEDLRRGWLKFDEARNVAFHLFGRIWNFADRHAPYSLRVHEGRRVR
jgi:hypothetical protein